MFSQASLRNSLPHISSTVSCMPFVSSFSRPSRPWVCSLVAFVPPTQPIAVKLIGVVLASLSSGGGELSFLGLTHYYGHMSLASWGSGTGAAGLLGAGLYVLLTDWIGFSVKSSLLASAFLPAIMLISFFFILPRGPLREAGAKEYEPLPERDLQEEDSEEMPTGAASSSLLAPGPGVTSAAYSVAPREDANKSSLIAHLQRARSLFLPYMLPLLPSLYRRVHDQPRRLSNLAVSARLLAFLRVPRLLSVLWLLVPVGRLHLPFLHAIRPHPLLVPSIAPTSG